MTNSLTYMVRQGSIVTATKGSKVLWPLCMLSLRPRTLYLCCLSCVLKTRFLSSLATFIPNTLLLFTFSFGVGVGSRSSIEVNVPLYSSVFSQSSSVPIYELSFGISSSALSSFSISYANTSSPSLSHVNFAFPFA